MKSTSVQLQLAFGGTQTFQDTELEITMAHMATGGSNVMQSQGIGFIVGEPGLLVADTNSPAVRNLLYQYTPQPNVANDPPVGFAQGSSVVDLRSALRAGGAIIDPSQTTAQVLAANTMAYYARDERFQRTPRRPRP